jgi:tetratricopeptide (TPR) repeat protein
MPVLRGLALAGVYEVGVALAYAGRKEAAIREGERAVAMDTSQSQNATYYRHQLARIYTMTGEQEKALDLLERLLARPYYLSPGWLRIDPTFDPLRSNPRFKRLVEGK